MNEELRALLREVRSSPDEQPALVLADWLEEHGLADEAELTRLGLEYERRFLGPRAESSSREMWGREEGPTHDDIYPRLCELEQSVTDEGLRALAAGFTGHAHLGISYRRGLLRLCPSEFTVAQLRQLLDWLEARPDLTPWMGGLYLRYFWTEPETAEAREAALIALLAHPVLGRCGAMTISHELPLTAPVLTALAGASNLAGLTGLNLEGASELDPQAMTLLAGAPWLEGLASLGLSRRPGDEVVAALLASPRLAGLRCLRLELGEPAPRTLRTLAGARHLGGLESLAFSCEESAPADFRPLAAAEHFPRLREVDLRSTSLRDPTASALARGPLLKGVRYLWLGNNRITDQGAVALARSGSLQRLEELDLSNNQIGDAGAQALARSRRLPALRSLRLTWNPITLASVPALKAVRGRVEVHYPFPTSARERLDFLTDPNLAQVEVMEMNGWGLTAEDVIRLVECPYLANATHLDLGRNPGRKTKAVEALARSPHVSRLRWLNLADMTLGSAAITALARSKNLPELQTLILASARIGDRGTDALARATGLPRLARLALDNNAISQRGARALARSALLGQLRALALSANPIGSDALFELLSSPRWGPVAELYLACSGVDDRCCEVLASGAFADLEVLHFGNVYTVTARGVEVVLESPHLPKLRKLQMPGVCAEVVAEHRKRRPGRKLTVAYA